MSKNITRKVGTTIVFDVTAGGYILPGELKERFGARAFIKLVSLDGEEAILTSISPSGQYNVTFFKGYTICGISPQHFVDVEDTDLETEEGVPIAEQESKSFQETIEQQIDELEQDVDTSKRDEFLDE